MTPLKEWTWDYADYPRDPGHPAAAVRLRNYCWLQCKCKTTQFKRPGRRLMGKIWPLLGGDVRYMSNPRLSAASLQPVVEDTQDTAASLQPVVEDAQGTWSETDCFKGLGCLVAGLHRGPLGSCKPNPIVIDIQQTCQGSSSSRHTSSCRNNCTSPRDCTAQSSDECNYRPACIAQPATSSVLTDLSNVLTTWMVGQCVAKVNQNSRPGGKRSLEDMDVAAVQGKLKVLEKENTRRLKGILGEETDEKEMLDTAGHPCVCNASYVSHACCHAGETGLVWERPDFALGRLEV